MTHQHIKISVNDQRTDKSKLPDACPQLIDLCRGMCSCIVDVWHQLLHFHQLKIFYNLNLHSA